LLPHLAGVQQVVKVFQAWLLLFPEFSCG
jgi:hypothetical protein